MYRLKSIVFMMSLFCFNSAYAEKGEAAGKVLQIRSHDASLGTDADWVKIDNSSAGTCQLYEGKVIFKIKDNDRGKRHISMLLAAKLANKSVVIGYDDVGLNTGYCSVRYIDIE